ncbi:MAG: MFS transporter [Bdellovibrionales bacterium]
MSDTDLSSSTLRRDVLVTSLVGGAHFTSHFFQLSLAPLFPILHDVFDASYVMLGSVMTVFYLVSGICQAFAGVLVDRFGPRPALLFGILSMAVCVGLAGLVTHFWMFYPLFILAGIGNSVFHPADFSALSHQVSKPRMGRAFSIHSSSGTLGYAMAPLVIGFIAAHGNWRVALCAGGLMGLAVAGLVYRYGRECIPDHGYGDAARPAAKISYRQLIAMPALLFAFGYFLFTSAAGGAIQNFSIASFMDFYGVTLKTATTALSAYLISSAIGMLLGGVIADHTFRHVAVAVTGLLSCAFLMCLVASGFLSFNLVVVTLAAAGLCQGITAPSRDILVKGATPPGATGRVFGFVYSGLDAGSMVAPILFGALVDRHAYHLAYFGIAALFATA